MTTNVIALPGAMAPSQGQPVPQLIQMLELLIEKAKTGELQSLIGTGFTSNRKRMSVWVDLHDNVYEQLGALELLKLEYAHRHDLSK